VNPISRRIAEWRYRRNLDRMFRWSVDALGTIAQTNPALARATRDRARRAIRDPETGRPTITPEGVAEFFAVHQEALAYEHRRLGRRPRRNHR
jgi:hypothetical protein